MTDSKKHTKEISVVVFEGLPNTKAKPATPAKYQLKSLEAYVKKAAASASSPSAGGGMVGGVMQPATGDVSPSPSTDGGMMMGAVMGASAP